MATESRSSNSVAAGVSAPSPQRRDERTPQREGGGSRREGGGGGGGGVGELAAGRMRGQGQGRGRARQAALGNRPPLPPLSSNAPSDTQLRSTGGASAALGGSDAAAASGENIASASYCPTALVEALFRYENMIRLQEKEDTAVEAHLRPLFERLVNLGKRTALAVGDGSSNNNGHDNNNSNDKEEEEEEEDEDDGIPKLTMSSSDDDGCIGDVANKCADGARRGRETMLSFSSLATALERIDALTCNDSSNAACENQTGSAGPIGNGPKWPEDELISSDRQLVLALRTITDAHIEHIRRTGTKPPCNGDDGLTFSEFLHCYRTVIAGMQAMQRIPPSCDDTVAAETSGAVSMSTTRARTRERTLQAVRLFGPMSGEKDVNRNVEAAVCLDMNARDLATLGKSGVSTRLLLLVAALAAVALAAARAIFVGGAVRTVGVETVPMTHAIAEETLKHDINLGQITATSEKVQPMIESESSPPSASSLPLPTRQIVSQTQSNSISDLLRPVDSIFFEEYPAKETHTNVHNPYRHGFVSRDQQRQSLTAALGGAALAAFLSSMPGMAPHSLALAAAAGLSALVAGGKTGIWLRCILEWVGKLSGLKRRKRPRP